MIVLFIKKELLKIVSISDNLYDTIPDINDRDKPAAYSSLWMKGEKEIDHALSSLSGYHITSYVKFLIYGSLLIT